MPRKKPAPPRPANAGAGNPKKASADSPAPDEITFPRQVKITGKNHPHHGKTGTATGDVARPPGSDEDMLLIKLDDGQSCYADPLDTTLIDDVKALVRPSKRAAESQARKKAKPRVTNGGAAGNAWNPMETPAEQEPHGDSQGRKIAKPSTPRCGARNREGNPCGNAAGFKTDHPGVGRCHLHGGLTPAPTGRYSSIKRPRVRELLEQFEADPDPMNLLPEVQLLRGLIHDYIDRYATQDEMLERWHRSFEKEFKKAWENWWREARANILEVQDDLTLEEEAAKMPDPMDFLPSKPLRMADITEAGSLISRVGTLIKLVRDMQSQHTFTMDTVNLLWKVMGGHITDAALEVIVDDDIRESYLASVERRFGTISLAELASRRAQDSP